MPKEKGKKRLGMKTGAALLILNTYTITFLCRKIQDSLERSPTSSHLLAPPTFPFLFPPIFCPWSFQSIRVVWREAKNNAKKKRSEIWGRRRRRRRERRRGVKAWKCWVLIVSSEALPIGVDGKGGGYREQILIESDRSRNCATVVA